MSDRERWIVYPLLFLAIGLALHSNIEIEAGSQDTHTAEADVVKCKTLEIIGPEGASNPQARLTANPSGAMLSLFDRDGQSVIRIGHDQGLSLLVARASADGKMYDLPLYGGPVVALPKLKLQPKGSQPQPQPKPATEPPAQDDAKPDHAE